MINKYIFLFITGILAYSEESYGLLDLNEVHNFSVANSYNTQISFLSFQGPIQFARVSEDGKLIELKPIPGTYFFYDYVNESSSQKAITYTAYGSKGGATYPQYRFSTEYKQIDLKSSQVTTYNNQSVNYRSENGFLILDVPMVLYRDGSLINTANFLINIGYQKDKEYLKLSSYIFYSKDRPVDFSQSDYNKMTFANYHTTFYIKMDPRDTYDYFAVICDDFQFPLGGSTFTINYQSNSDSNTWIWILVTLILVLLLIVVGWYMNYVRRKKEEKEDPSNFQQSFQQFS